LWVKSDSWKQKFDLAKWSNYKPKRGYWIGFNNIKINAINIWLMNHSFTLSGGKVWKQIIKIPMGFSRSQSLYNLYFLFYKCKFIQRLAKLGRVFDKEKIKYVLKYNYDIC
jgi:hypothetical protein